VFCLRALKVFRFSVSDNGLTVTVWKWNFALNSSVGLGGVWLMDIDGSLFSMNFDFRSRLAVKTTVRQFPKWTRFSFYPRLEVTCEGLYKIFWPSFIYPSKLSTKAHRHRLQLQHDQVQVFVQVRPFVVANSPAISFSYVGLHPCGKHVATCKQEKKKKVPKGYMCGIPCFVLCFAHYFA